ncbi:MAG: M23 family metallopeptidase [Ruminococcus sp.]|nr:M23 family metallopeptidase [Ruminococcus sp.]
MKTPKLASIKKLVGGRGLYITAAASIIAVGGVGAAAYNRAVSRIDDSLSYTAPEISDVSIGELFANQPKADVPLDADSSEEEITSSGSEQPAAVTQPNVMPVNGEVLVPFSFGELVKSETLDVWKTHDGVDLKADTGTPVKAMNRGEVTKVWEDALWGYCVTIDHGSGLEGHYYNLGASVLVEEGDQVESGQVIGMVGDTAQIEAAEPSHLHFGLKRLGEWIDPIGYIDPFGYK